MNGSPQQPDRAAAAASSGAPVPPAPAVTASEKSLIGRFVAIFTPVFAIVAAWLAGLVAQAVPGAHLGKSQIVAFMTAAAASAITAGWKWLQGWQQHEALVAQGKDIPRRPGQSPATFAASPARKDDR